MLSLNEMTSRLSRIESEKMAHLGSQLDVRLGPSLSITDLMRPSSSIARWSAWKETAWRHRTLAWQTNCPTLETTRSKCRSVWCLLSAFLCGPLLRMTVAEALRGGDFAASTATRRKGEGAVVERETAHRPSNSSQQHTSPVHCPGEHDR